jgi:hypothetical protein
VHIDVDNDETTRVYAKGAFSLVGRMRRHLDPTPICIIQCGKRMSNHNMDQDITRIVQTFMCTKVIGAHT